MSLEDTAQHLLEPGATRHMSPSFFRQKPMARRHSYVLVVVVTAGVDAQVAAQSAHALDLQVGDLRRRLGETGAMQAHTGVIGQLTQGHSGS